MACKAWNTHPHPARINEAYSNGAVETSKAGLNAVMHPNLMIWNDCPGDLALGKLLGDKKQLVQIPRVAEEWAHMIICHSPRWLT